MNYLNSTVLRAYLWICLVLHALNQHALDNFHVMLLLVPKDSWEVPKTKQRPILVNKAHNICSLTLLIMQILYKHK